MLDIVFLVLGVMLAWKVYGAARFPEAGFVFFAAYALYVYLGGILMGFDEFYAASPNYERLIWVIRGGYISLILSTVIVSQLERFLLPRYKGGLQFSNGELAGVKILAVLCLLGSITYLILMPGNPLGAMFSNPEIVAQEREAVTVKMKSFGFFSNIFYNFMPIVWLTLYFSGCNRFAVFVFVANLICLIATGQKSPLLYSFMMVTLAVGAKNGSFPYRKTTVGILGLTAILTGVVVLQNWHLLQLADGNVVSLALEGLFRRAFMVGAIALLNYLDTFPSVHPFLMDSMSSLPPDRIVYANTYGYQIEGTVNAVSLGNFYAYFGDTSIAACLMFVLAVAFNFGGRLFSICVKPNPATQAFYIGYCVLGLKLVITDWYTVLPVFWLSFFVFWGWLYSCRAIANGLGTGRWVVQGRLWFVVASLISLAYFMQGQARALIGSGG